MSSRARFWDELRTLMRRLLWESWAQMMEFVGNEELALLAVRQQKDPRLESPKEAALY
ncbi:MAG: hypothetical protein WKF84_19860 [Pyrinomonadaceae bacterium]